MNKFLFGAGFGCFKYLHQNGKQDYICIIDNDPSKHDENLFGLDVCSPDILKNFNLKTVEVLVTASARNEISDRLISIGILKKNIRYLTNDEIHADSFGKPEQTSFANSLMKTILHNLNKSNIIYYAIAGTLLGLVREGKLIDWDYDLDFAVDPISFEQLISHKFDLTEGNNNLFMVKKLVMKTFPESDYVPTNSYSKLQLIFSDNNKNLIIADFHPFYKKSDKVFITHTGFDLFSFPAYHFEKTVPFLTQYGICNIPESSEELLTFVYGDWKVPNDSFRKHSHLNREL